MSKAKVLLNYDTTTGQLTTDSGLVVGAPWLGLDIYEGADRPTVDDIVKLKEAGFTAEEIVMMVKKEVL